MKSARKLLVTGLTGLTVAAGTLALPFTHSANAMPVQEMKRPQKVLSLQKDGNDAVGVSTELDCATHTLTAKVTNKTDATITPKVTFNGEDPTIPSTLPIEAGKTGNYFYNFSGNHLLVDTEVRVDTYSPVTVSPTLNCTEPVSFQVTDTSSSAVVGNLTNNSTIVPQIVYTRVDNGDIRLEVLQPGETRLVALPFTSWKGQVNAMVTIATSAGYESNYTVDLGTVTPPQPIKPLER